MKLRTFIITTGVAFALAAPAAQASFTSNRLFQTKVHTVLAEQKSVKATESTKAAKADYSRAYQVLRNTVEADKAVGAIGIPRPLAPKPPAMLAEKKSSSTHKTVKTAKVDLAAAARAYQTWIHTIGADQRAEGLTFEPQSPSSTRR